MSYTTGRTGSTDTDGGSRPSGAALTSVPEATPAVSLPQIARDIETFFDNWSPRMQQLLDRCRDLAEREEEVRQAEEGLKEQRRAWDAQRQREDEEINETVQQLTDAWLRLESEQRALLRAQESLQQRGQNQDAALRTLTQREGRIIVQRSAASEAPSSGAQSAEEPASLSRQMAVQQFERLKRELNHHMQGNG